AAHPERRRPVPSLSLPPRAPQRAPLAERLRAGGAALLRSRAVAALAAPHGVDRYLELLDPSFTVHEGRARVVGVRRQGARSVTLTLRTSPGYGRHRPGQFVELGYALEGVRRVRC